MTPQELVAQLTDEEGYTVEALSDFAGVTRQYLYQVRNGKEVGLSIAPKLQSLLDGTSSIEDAYTNAGPQGAKLPSVFSQLAQLTEETYYNWRAQQEIKKYAQEEGMEQAESTEQPEANPGYALAFVYVGIFLAVLVMIGGLTVHKLKQSGLA